MKYKVKVEENRFVVTNSKDVVISVWGSKQIEDMGGLEKCIENFKKSNPKAEIEVVGSVPAEPAPVPAEPVVPAEPAPVPAEPAPVPAEPAPAPAN